MSSTGLFKVIKASAGSGKTFTLVKEYLLLALRAGSPNYYRHILAITFTNAAAAEMKERVIKRLAEFSSPGHTSILFDDIATQLNVSPQELAKRSTMVFSHMLHHYGLLSILTIDSFTHKLIRTFSKDLHLRYDFTIETETTDFLEKVVDLCIEDVGKDAELTKYLEKFILQKLEDGKSWDFRKELVKISSELLKENSLVHLKKIENLTFEDFNAISKKLRLDNITFENDLATIAEEALALIHAHGLEEKDFYQTSKGPYGHFKKIKNGEVTFPNKFAQDALVKDKWKSGSIDSGKASALQNIVPNLHELLNNLQDKTNPEALGIYELKKLIRKNIYALGLLKRLSDLSFQLKEENNLLLIADFHKLINEVIKDNEAPFIYERLGTRYKHILIDEFQDTSVMQWSNALPLIQNALGENNMSLIVGDAKQAIYRWRGGDVNQFISLPKLDPTTAPHGSGDFLANHYDSFILDSNFRSAKEIIEFNNRFYTQLSSTLGHFESVYHDVNQKVKRNNTGYVRVVANKEKDKDVREVFTSDFILESVKESIESGYRPKDIAILTRTGKDGAHIASILTQHGYQVVTKESFLINHSPVVRCIMAYFEFLSNSHKKFPPIELVRGLSEIHSDIHFETFITQYTYRTGKDLKVDLEKFLLLRFGQERISDSSVSVFSQAIRALRYFQLEADTPMEFLLEKIKEKCTQQKMSLAIFLQWWNDQKEKLYTAATAGEQSIQVMTIHKSKGLQFPVVIYPRLGSKDNPNDLWIASDEARFGIPAALVTSRKTTSKKSEGIAWPEEFEEEETRQQLDEVNTAYVATTRAEDRLYIIQETSCDKWLSKEFIRVMEAQYQDFLTTGIWESGEKKNNAHVEIQSTAETIRFSGKNFLQPQLRIQTPTFQNSESQLYGNQLHACLALISSVADTEAAVKKTMKLFAIHDVNLENKLTHDLEKILKDEQISAWFQPGVHHMNEREIGMPDGKIFRPDRIVVFPDRVDIIDFKTGQHADTYLEQVRTYMQALRSIYQVQVRGYLLYTQDPKVVEVS